MSWFLTRAHMGMTKPQLNEIWGRIPGKSPLTGQAYKSTTKAQFVEEIEELRRDQLNRSHQEAQSRPKAQSSLCEITAKEANEWLQSLPPTPPAYDLPDGTTNGY